MPQPFRQILISSALNVNVESFEITSQQAPGSDIPWVVRKLRLRGGRQEGVDLIEVHNGRMVMRIVATRGMSIYDAQMEDVRLGWDSPVNEIVHPMFVNLNSRGGLGWLEGFNEWLVRCGLEWFGPPGEETEHLARAEAPVNFRTLHGRIANIPASQVELIVQTREPYTITIRGLVCERMMFGPKLDLHTDISTIPGSDSFTVTDRITNVSSQPAEFGLLYHLNTGRPILEDGAVFRGAVERVTPINARAAEGGVANYARYSGPIKGYAEQVYLLKMLADRSGRTRAMLHNRRGDMGLSMSYSTRQLPCFTIWKNTLPDADGYVTGLEPGTSYPHARPVERQAGRVPRLRSGGVFEASMDFTVHADRKGVQTAAGEIDKIQGRKKPQIDEEPGE